MSFIAARSSKEHTKKLVSDLVKLCRDVVKLAKGML